MSDKTMGSIVSRLIVCAIFIGVGAYFLHQEYASPPTHDAHLYAAGGLLLFGAILIDADPVLDVAKRVLALAKDAVLARKGPDGAA